MQRKRVLTFLAFPLLALAAGCEENPITEGLLKASPAEKSGRNDSREQDAVFDDFPAFEGTYSGEAGTAIIAGEDDALTLSVSAYRIWHMQNVLRSLDNLARDLILRDEQGGDLSRDEVWTGAFSGNNCGDASAVTLENNGEEGRVSFSGFCVEGVSRSDNHRYRLNGEMQWQDGRTAGPDGFGNQQPASRRVTMEGLRVEWRGRNYSLTGLSTLNDDGSQLFRALDTQLEDSARQWRLRTVLFQDGTRRTERLLQEGRLGGMQLVVDTNSGWVTSGGSNCPQRRGAGGGQVRLFSEGTNNQAAFRMTLASCDLFNLLDGAVDSDGNSLPAGPFDLSEKL